MHVEFFLAVRTEGRVRLDARPTSRDTASPRRDTAAAVLVLLLAAWPCELLFGLYSCLVQD